MTSPEATTTPTPRKSLSFLVKMVLSAGILVTLVVAVMSVLDLMALLKAYDERASEQERLGTLAIKREGFASAQALATSVAPALADNMYSLLEGIIAEKCRKDANALYSMVVQKDAPEKNAQTQCGRKQPDHVKMVIVNPKDAPPPQPITVGNNRALLFIQPIVFDNKLQGEIRTAYSLAELDHQLAEIKKSRESANRKGIIRSFTVGLFCLILGLILAILQGLQVTRPVRHLSQKATEIANGNLGTRVEIKSGDEFGQLGTTFNFMAERIQALLVETAEKVKMQGELEIAKTVQDRLVASQELVQMSGLQVAGYYQPASSCGGDFWNYFDIGGGRILMIVADVTGHGVASAMITASAKGCCDTLLAIYGSELTVDYVMQALNLVVFRAGQGALQMTCFVLILDQANKSVSYASAGHPMPYLCRLKEGRYALQSMISRGNRLGDGPEWISQGVVSSDLQSGDVIVAFTDGIVEGQNPEGREWGEKDFRRILQKNAELPPTELRDLMVEKAYEYYRGIPPNDDLTLVVTRVV